MHSQEFTFEIDAQVILKKKYQKIYIKGVRTGQKASKIEQCANSKVWAYTTVTFGSSSNETL